MDILKLKAYPFTRLPNIYMWIKAGLDTLRIKQLAYHDVTFELIAVVSIKLLLQTTPFLRSYMVYSLRYIQYIMNRVVVFNIYWLIYIIV